MTEKPTVYLNVDLADARKALDELRERQAWDAVLLAAVIRAIEHADGPVWSIHFGAEAARLFGDGTSVAGLGTPYPDLPMIGTLLDLPVYADRHAVQEDRVAVRCPNRLQVSVPLFTATPRWRRVLDGIGSFFNRIGGGR